MTRKTKLEYIRDRVERVKFHKNYETEAQVDREYLMDIIGLMQQALDLALPELDYDKRFAAVHESVVQTLNHREEMDATELANVLTARALQSLEATMEVPY